MDLDYVPPLSLTVIGAIFLLTGSICGIIIALEVLFYRRWRTMMGIMIPTYVITALYLGPLAIWIYARYGRREMMGEHKHHGVQQGQTSTPQTLPDATANPRRDVNVHDTNMQNMKIEEMDMYQEMPQIKHDHMDMSEPERRPAGQTVPEHTNQTPLYISVALSVCHCGAGCVLGDIVGEWIVYATNVQINGRSLWPEMLIGLRSPQPRTILPFRKANCLSVDYAFALFFGIFFQYFSIAPMSGEWGIKTFIRAAKADFASLTAFEIGLFGWMAIYQVGIWDWRLGMVNTVYWWMMQVGMILGFVTSYPMNWILIKYGIKEPM